MMQIEQEIAHNVKLARDISQIQTDPTNIKHATTQSQHTSISPMSHSIAFPLSHP